MAGAAISAGPRNGGETRGTRQRNRAREAGGEWKRCVPYCERSKLNDRDSCELSATEEEKRRWGSNLRRRQSQAEWRERDAQAGGSVAGERSMKDK